MERYNCSLHINFSNVSVFGGVYYADLYKLNCRIERSRGEGSGVVWCHVV